MRLTQELVILYDGMLKNKDLQTLVTYLPLKEVSFMDHTCLGLYCESRPNLLVNANKIVLAI